MAAKLRLEASSFPARGETQEPVKVHVLSAVLTWSLSAAKRGISMPEQCHGHDNKRRLKHVWMIRGISCCWVEQVHKEMTLVHCLKPLLTSECFILDDAFFAKRELKKIPELQAETVAG